MKRRKKHNIFISYYHKDDQEYKNKLEKMNIQSLTSNKKESIYGQNRSVKQNSIKDEGLTSEQIRKEIRKNYIRDGEVLILLCGENTRKRKHIDWEIHAAMSNNLNEKQLGILIINLPGCNNGIRLSSLEEAKVLKYNETNINYPIQNKEINNYYPSLPNRIKENLTSKDIKITIINWDDIYNKPKKMMYFIDNAYKYSKTNKYNTSTPLKRKNS